VEWERFPDKWFGGCLLAFPIDRLAGTYLWIYPLQIRSKPDVIEHIFEGHLFFVNHLQHLTSLLFFGGVASAFLFDRFLVDVFLGFGNDLEGNRQSNFLGILQHGDEINPSILGRIPMPTDDPVFIRLCFSSIESSMMKPIDLLDFAHFSLDLQPPIFVSHFRVGQHPTHLIMTDIAVHQLR